MVEELNIGPKYVCVWAWVCVVLECVYYRYMYVCVCRRDQVVSGREELQKEAEFGSINEGMKEGWKEGWSQLY